MSQIGRPLKVDPEIELILEAIEDSENDFVMKSLLEKGIDIYDSYGRNALINSVFCNNREIFQWVMNHGTDVNFQDNVGYSALHAAAQVNNFEMTKLLIDKGADVNIIDKHGNSPIWTAIMNYNGGENLNLIKLLFEKGANLDQKNIYGRSAGEISGSIFNS